MAGTNPRAARIAALIKRVIASSIEHHLHDKRLMRVTVTEVRVTNDLQIATVYWTQFGDEGKADGERQRAQQALVQAAGKLRSLVGSKVGLRLTPQLRFVYDEIPSEAHEIEDILVTARQRDEALEQARAHAQYAGDPDPYRHDDDDADGDDNGDDNTEAVNASAYDQTADGDGGEDTEAGADGDAEIDADDDPAVPSR